MVASTITLPNIRKMFIPDGGHTVFDADLAGADAQVVAWEANDNKLKQAFREGLKVHCVNARSVWPEICGDMDDDEIKNYESGKLYKSIKIGVHGTNYGGQAPGLAGILNWPVADAVNFQRRWFRAHPEILEWHKRIERSLSGEECWNCGHLPEFVGKPCPRCNKALGNTVRNAFGFTRTYFSQDRNTFTEALAWSPQSTVAIVTELGWMNLFNTPEEIEQYILSIFPTYQFEKPLREYFLYPNTSEWTREIVKALLQVHDSFIGQTLISKSHLIPDIVKGMQVKVPFDDPLIIPWDYNTSNQSWGDCG